MDTPSPEPFTRNERRRISRHSPGRLDDGRYAVPTKNITAEMARAIFAAWDDELVFTAETLLVDWCPHSADYAYRHGCGDWCDRPTPRVVWVAR